eukprot:jgi/Mesvir1/15044/Mv14697-RA.1
MVGTLAHTSSAACRVGELNQTSARVTKPRRAVPLPASSFCGRSLCLPSCSNASSRLAAKRSAVTCSGMPHIRDASHVYGLTPEKIRQALGGGVVDYAPHFMEYIKDLPSYPNPVKKLFGFQNVKDVFVGPHDVVASKAVSNIYEPDICIHYVRAGPRETICFDPEDTRVAIVTCGGLCPGLNTVVREVVMCLWTNYGVRHIYGVQNGYRGFYAHNMVELNPRSVSAIHRRGGTVLGSSRGGHDTKRIVDSLVDRDINQVYVIGGDGTQRGAKALYEEIRARGLKIAIVGIPKTIDNDVLVIDKSFGFDSAVEEAQRAIAAAHVEAESYPHGIGLVKVMGRHAGFIAMHATLASRDVDCCLIPEVPFFLDGPDGLFEFVRHRLKTHDHCLIVIAEGAELGGLNADDKTRLREHDPSGNVVMDNVGLMLGKLLKDHFSHEKTGLPGGASLKYIDPTYMIRAIPPNASDNIYCSLLAHSAIHGAFAGYTGFVAGPVNGRHCYIPMERVTEGTARVNIHDRMWARLMSSTGQPDFMRAPEKGRSGTPMPGQDDLHVKHAELIPVKVSGKENAKPIVVDALPGAEARNGAVLATKKVLPVNGKAMPKRGDDSEQLVSEERDWVELREKHADDVDPDEEKKDTRDPLSSTVIKS